VAAAEVVEAGPVPAAAEQRVKMEDADEGAEEAKAEAEDRPAAKIPPPRPRRRGSSTA
jgi:hypothetical protein